VNKLKKSLLSASIALALGGAGVAPETQAIHLAEDGIGQVLLAPMYLAKFGYNTKITVVNTRPDVAVKAKVIIRSQKESVEVLDFVLYLSPGDVWRGEIRANEDGQAYLYSDDDSLKAVGDENTPRGSSIFADVQPVSQMLYDGKLNEFDNNEVGHIEVIGVYGIAAGSVIDVPEGEDVTIFRTMSKHDLAAIFDTPRATLTSLNGPEIAVVGRNELTGIPYGLDNGGNEIAAPSGLIRSTDPTWINLTGSVEMTNVNTGDRIGYRIPALAGEAGDNVPPEGTYNYPASGDKQERSIPFDGRVVSNPDFDEMIGSATMLGNRFGRYAYGRDTFSSYDNIVEIEHALATTIFNSSYEDDSRTFVGGESAPGINRTQLAVIFPTKYRHGHGFNPCNDTAMSEETRNALIASGAIPNLESYPYTAPFFDLGDVPFSLTEYDNRENLYSIVVERIPGDPFSGRPTTSTPDVGLCDNMRCLSQEVNYFLPSWTPTYKSENGSVEGHNFESGWFELNLMPQNGCSYIGVPSLGFTHKYHEFEPGTFSNSWFAPMAHKPELVNRQWPLYPPTDVKND